MSEHHHHDAPPMRLEEARARLAGASGPEYWRSLEELAASPGFEEMLHREFPEQASEWIEGFDRRRFLQLAAASLSLAGLTACTRQPLEKIVPYVKQPEELVPGRPLFYATSMALGGYAEGLLVESHEGRPTKIEGNPEHPASLGGSSAFAQAAILGLYDPDRSQVLTQLGEIQTWESFLKVLAAKLAAQKGLGGEGIRILTETVTSPTLADQIRALLVKYPKARWHQYEPAGRHSARAGAIAAFGAPVETRYDFAKADVIVTLDADFVAEGPGALRYARDFAGRRRVREEGPAMSRLYAVESAPTLTGSLADHRLNLRAADIPRFALALAAELGLASAPRSPLTGVPSGWVGAMAADLKAHPGRALVVPGECASPEVHVLAQAMNQALGADGSTVLHTDPVEAQPIDQLASLRELTAAMAAGHVDLLAIIGGNPVFTAPSDLEFTQALLKVPMRIHLALESDETSEYCQWHVPEAHFLEAWSDARAFDGTAGVVQPLIEPLYGGKSAHELLSAFVDETPRSGYEIVRSYWRAQSPAASFEASWRRTLHDGLVAGTTFAPRAAAVRTGAAAQAAAAIDASGTEPAAAEAVFRPDCSVLDGRFANNAWLQELPRPGSKVTWDNPACIAPAMAEQLGLANGDLAEIAIGSRTLTLPVWILPGSPEGSIVLRLGGGRRRSGKVGTGVGFNVYPLRSLDQPWSAPSATIRKTGGNHPIASTQEHFAMEGRNLVRTGTLAGLKAHPEIVREMEEVPSRDLNFFSGFKYDGHAWGLAVDLGACTGCNACVVACQAENNIPTVGKEQVARGREMHWIRIDRYYQGDPRSPFEHNQPVMCMHCEQAPCEVVCPVGATNHSSEGLNDMVYNRCVGTRYCSNNCPYKVRRFNFLKYNDDKTPVLRLLHNPDVTVRSRGVMEKCTYCVQRINSVRIDAEREGRPIRDGEIQTACQQSCPSEAIVFGDINDPASRVSRWKAEPTNYGLLEPLNTRPRTSYLAKIRNPNPSLEET